MPHDVIITGAMLHIVAVVARFDKEGLKRKIEEMTHEKGMMNRVSNGCSVDRYNRTR